MPDVPKDFSTSVQHFQVCVGVNHFKLEQRLESQTNAERRSSKFLMIEVQDSVEFHQTSIKDRLHKKLGESRPLLATSPRRRYLKLIR